jgi:hypothetical protein
MAEKKSTKPAAKKAAPAKAKPGAKNAALQARPAEVKAKIAAKKGKLAEIKTKPTTVSVADFINSIEGEQKRKDSFDLVEIMKKASGEEPAMWGGSIIGFGNKRYRSPNTTREVDWFLIGFSPRKANITLYLTTIMNEHAAVLEKLGKYKTGGGCIYINKLADVDLKVLNTIINTALKKKAE